MNSEPIVIEQTYNASISKVWQALTDNEQMKQWYFKLAEFKPEVGFEFSFDGGSEEKTYTHLCKVLEVIPEKKLSYSWKYKNYEGNSVVTFELFDEGNNQTKLKLTHTGIETFPQNSKDFSRESFSQGWAYITATSLKKFVKQ